MALYELAVQTTQTVSGNPALEIVAGANAPMEIEEIEVVNNAATANTWLLGRPGNTPAGGTSTKATLPINRPPGGAASVGGLLVSGWTTAPTQPAAGNTIRWVGLPATQGAGWLAVWQSEQLIIDPTRSGSLVLWLTATAPVFNVRIKWRE